MEEKYMENKYNEIIRDEQDVQRMAKVYFKRVC